MADWDPTTYDPETDRAEDRMRDNKRARRHGVDGDTVNAWLRAIWIDFEKKLDERCKRFWDEAGMAAPDATKATCRRLLHESLRKEFGRSLPDRDWTDALEARLERDTSPRRHS